MKIMKARLVIASVALMATINSSTLSSALTLEEEKPAKTFPENDPTRIIGGEFVPSGTYPWFTMLLYMVSVGYELDINTKQDPHQQSTRRSFIKFFWEITFHILFR